MNRLDGSIVVTAGPLQTTSLYTGSFEMGTSVAARVDLVPLSIPAGEFMVDVQLEQGLDNLWFQSVGAVVKISNATPKQVEIGMIGGGFVRALVTFFTELGGTATIAVRINPVPNPNDPDPVVVIPGLKGIGSDQLAAAFTWQFALAAQKGRLGGGPPVFPGLFQPADA